MSDIALETMLEQLRARGDGQHRHTLPPSFYTSADWLQHETEALLRREWLCLCRVDEIPRAGNYITRELLGEPLLIVRDRENALRVLANVCRHRNMPVAEGSGQARLFVCPYHAWSYNLDGSLLNAPYMDDVDKSACSLPLYRSEIWQGFVFVNLDGEADALTPRLQGLDAILANYHSDELHHVFVEEDMPITERGPVPHKARTLFTADGRITRFSTGETEVYDFGTDPDELDNLATSDPDSTYVREMQDRLTQTLIDYADLARLNAE